MNAKMERLKQGLDQIVAEAHHKAQQLKDRIGDQDGDGDVDLSDVKIRIEARTGHIGPRECAFVAFGMALAFVVLKVVPLVAKLF